MIILSTYRSSHPMFVGNVFMDLLNKSYGYEDEYISFRSEIDGVFNKPLPECEGFTKITRRKRKK